ncbi:MAG: AsmA family protein [Chlorobi bacterium]|nr:AsmA family protein [Chlorobiota bacterium]
MVKQKTTKNRFWKFVRIFTLSIVLFVSALVIIAALSEKKIARLAFRNVKESLNVPLEVNEISFTLLKKFPLATVEFKNMKLGYPADSMSTSFPDSVVSIDRLYISVESAPLIDGIFNVKDIEIEGADIDYVVGKNGISNFDFLLDTTATEEDTTSSLLDLTLKRLILKNVKIHYCDSSKSYRATIDIPEIKLKGKVKDEEYAGEITGNAFVTDVNIEGTPIDRMKQTEVKFDMGFLDDTLKISGLTVITDGAYMTAKGNAVIQDAVLTDLTFTGNNLDLGILKKYIPKDSLEKYGITDIAGTLNFTAGIKGEVSDSVIPYVEMNVELNDAVLSTRDYPVLEDINSEIYITNGKFRNDASTMVDIKKFSFRADSTRGNFSMKITGMEKPAWELNGELNVDLADLTTFIPDSLVKSVSGKIDAGFSTRGTLPDSITDEFIESTLNSSRGWIVLKNVSAEFVDSVPGFKELSGKVKYIPGEISAEGLFVEFPDYGLGLKNSSFRTGLKGSLTNLSKTVLDSIVFNIKTGNSEISGTGFVSNLTYPEYRIKANGDISFEDFAGAVPDTLINSMSGNVRFSVKSEGTLNPDSITDKITELFFKNSYLTAEASNLTVEMPDSLMSINNLSGRIKMVADSLWAYDVSGNYLDIGFSADDVKIFNLYDTYFLNMKKQLYVEGKYHLDDIDYSRLAPLVDTTETVDSLTEIQNYTLLMRGKISVNSLKYNKAVFKNMSALFKVTDSLYIIDKLKFNAFGGNADVSVRYEIKPGGKTVINTKHLINRIDINRLLSEFDDFKEYGNTEIEAKNIGGFVTAEMHIKAVMLGDSLLENETRVKGSFKIENGGIYNYKPAMDMAEFTGLKELDNIRFKTFESKIFMFKNKLYVPRTYIVSSALDIGFFGMESMGEDYEYHIQLHLGDVLKGKSQKLLKRQAESGDEVSDKDLDRSTVKLIYAYINGKSKVGFDRKKAQRMMELKIRTQEKMLDLVFFPKLVSFDTGVE